MNIHSSDLPQNIQDSDASPIFADPFALKLPNVWAAPVLFASPHSGSTYPDSVMEAIDANLMSLRRTEDAHIDSLFEGVPQLGGALLAAHYARIVTDLNRDPRELDPDMFVDGAPRTSGMTSPRVEAGLGCFPRISAYGDEIYSRKLTREEGEARLLQIHDPYHTTLGNLLQQLRHEHRRAVLIDCHSMPSRQPGRQKLADIILGDRFGASCSPKLTTRVERAFREAGFTVARNAPYAGGYTTRRYGRPKHGIHALQIEINRSLYMDETTLEPHTGFEPLKAVIRRVSSEILNLTNEIKAK